MDRITDTEILVAKDSEEDDAVDNNLNHLPEDSREVVSADDDVRSSREQLEVPDADDGMSSDDDIKLASDTDLDDVALQMLEKEVKISAANLLHKRAHTSSPRPLSNSEEELDKCSDESSTPRFNRKQRRMSRKMKMLSIDKFETYKTSVILDLCNDKDLDKSADKSCDSTDNDLDDDATKNPEEKGSESKFRKKLESIKIKNVFDSKSARGSLPLKRFFLMEMGTLEVYRIQGQLDQRIFKKLKPKFLKNWETHQIVLGEDGIEGVKAAGYMESPISYSSVEDVHIISRWDAGQKFCIRVTIQDGSLLLQANNSHLRDQWLYSIQWKKHMYKYEKLLKNCRRPEVLVKEIKNMIDVSLFTPIQDPSVYQFPLDLVSELLQRNADFITKVAHENIIVALAPLLENNHPTQEICDFFSKHCKNSPRSSIVIELFTPVVQRILKHNMDFGKFPIMRQFVQEYIQALSCQNAGIDVVKDFIRSMHGPASMCPHPRVLPNLVAVCLAAVYSLYEEKRLVKQDNLVASQSGSTEWERRVCCYIGMMEMMSLYEDWRYILGSLLQPIPFPNDALADDLFTSKMKDVIVNISTDKVCDVHQTILGIREGKEGWFHLYCPGNIGCDDDGELWGKMLKTLMHCCCKRKNFLFGLNKMIGPVMLLSLRENTAAMEVLCAMLECDVVENNDLKMQMVTTLQSTMSGKRMYAELCDRQIALRELQQKGGPKKLTLPSKSTDADLAKMLSSGSFGNLECLSLAFTQVTSACADDLIKLPSLRYLNLWSTQFGDMGLQKVSEHLHKLQVLNLCETPVTDKGLACLAALKNLRKLNLNSTNLSALVFEGLKEKLPALQECDVRYTDAW